MDSSWQGTIRLQKPETWVLYQKRNIRAKRHGLSTNRNAAEDTKMEAIRLPLPPHDAPGPLSPSKKNVRRWTSTPNVVQTPYHSSRREFSADTCAAPTPTLATCYLHRPLPTPILTLLTPTFIYHRYRPTPTLLHNETVWPPFIPRWPWPLPPYRNTLSFT